MNLLHIATRGTGNWRERLGDSETQWKRHASAMETAVSWEFAAKKLDASNVSGLPEPIYKLFLRCELGIPELLLAVAEHKVLLNSKGGNSQCDVWALVKIKAVTVSLAVEAKANEPFGSGNEPLNKWLISGKSSGSKQNRQERWDYISKNLPNTVPNAYDGVAYQILQRAAAAVIEARRFGLKHAVFIVQSFNCPETSFQAYTDFCKAAGVTVKVQKDRMYFVKVDAGTTNEVCLGIGWVECPFATDAEIAKVI
jgi:hypothetical protein